MLNMLCLQVPPELEDLPDVPSYFLCPISHSIMREPAVTSTGATYERSAIQEWLACNRCAEVCVISCFG